MTANTNVMTKGSLVRYKTSDDVLKLMEVSEFDERSVSGFEVGSPGGERTRIPRRDVREVAYQWFLTFNDGSRVWRKHEGDGLYSFWTMNPEGNKLSLVFNESTVDPLLLRYLLDELGWLEYMGVPESSESVNWN